VHRLDRDTSGVLLVAKKRSALRSLHEQLRVKTMRKQYLALVRGQWQPHVKVVNAPLRKNDLQSGERVVRVSSDGKASETRSGLPVSLPRPPWWSGPITGRTHQIRVHTQHAGHPIACDDKYGEAAFDDKMRSQGLKRLFLHAWKLSFIHPADGREMQVEAPLAPELDDFLNKLAR
jgi:23S rRNA pseudouridine955/2504/2580 synthase